MSFVKSLMNMNRDKAEEVVKFTSHIGATHRIINELQADSNDQTQEEKMIVDKVMEKSILIFEATDKANEIRKISSYEKRLAKAIELKLLYGDKLTERQFVNAVGEDEFYAIAALRYMNC